ncbi:hypothetical protein C8F04DRAFT_975257, partial [Mycena alexandri]
PCKVRAWVRAEDLSPDHVSRGELHLASPAECANQVASVALRLQFDEFGEVKYLKNGAVIPEVQASNQTALAEYLDWMGSDVGLDYQAHDDAMSNPELWSVRPKSDGRGRLRRLFLIIALVGKYNFYRRHYC